MVDRIELTSSYSHGRIGFEERLPATAVSQTERAMMDPWVESFVDLTSEQAIERLRARWADIEQLGMRAIRDHLLGFSSVSIVSTTSCDRVVVEDPRTPRSGSCGDRWYIAPPADPASIRSRLAAMGFSRLPLLAEFVTRFGGLSESIDCAGHFQMPDEYALFADNGWDYVAEDCDDYPEWADACRFYHANTGDALLVKPNGSVAWWDFPMNEVRPLMDSFDGFPAFYASSMALRWPLDSCGPPQDRDD